MRSGPGLPRLALVSAVLLAVGGCASATTDRSADPASAEADTPETRSPQGSLRQDEITVDLRVGDVQVRLTPLADDIISLTAPDTRRRLASAARSAPGDGVAFLVAVFTEAPGGRDFEPRDVRLENRGRVFRPSAIRGLTPGWGTRLEQRRPEQAVFVFPSDVDLDMPTTVEVAGVRSREWAAILPRIDAERARVRARGGAPQESRSNFRILR